MHILSYNGKKTFLKHSFEKYFKKGLITQDKISLRSPLNISLIEHLKYDPTP